MIALEIIGLIIAIVFPLGTFWFTSTKFAYLLGEERKKVYQEIGNRFDESSDRATEIEHSIELLSNSIQSRMSEAKIIQDSDYTKIRSNMNSLQKQVQEIRMCLKEDCSLSEFNASKITWNDKR